MAGDWFEELLSERDYLFRSFSAADCGAAWIARLDAHPRA